LSNYVILKRNISKYGYDAVIGVEIDVWGRMRYA
jgi:hypothetical protein